MDACQTAIDEADKLMDMAERLEDVPAAAEAQRSALYALLRQLLIETSQLREIQSARLTGER